MLLYTSAVSTCHWNCYVCSSSSHSIRVQQPVSKAGAPSTPHFPDRIWHTHCSSHSSLLYFLYKQCQQQSEPQQVCLLLRSKFLQQQPEAIRAAVRWDFPSLATYACTDFHRPLRGCTHVQHGPCYPYYIQCMESLAIAVVGSDSHQ